MGIVRLKRKIILLGDKPTQIGAGKYILLKEWGFS